MKTAILAGLFVLIAAASASAQVQFTYRNQPFSQYPATGVCVDCTPNTAPCSGPGPGANATNSGNSSLWTCASGLGPTATATPVPTSTATATSTPVPTPSPTPLVADAADIAIVPSAAATTVCPPNPGRISVLVQNKSWDPTGTTNTARVGSPSVNNTRGCIAAPNYGGCTFTSPSAIYAYSQNGATLGCSEDTH